MGYSVGIGLTNDCNLACAHCYRDTGQVVITSYSIHYTKLYDDSSVCFHRSRAISYTGIGARVGWFETGSLGNQEGLCGHRTLGPDCSDRKPGCTQPRRLSVQWHRERRGRSTHRDQFNRLDGRRGKEGC